MTLKPRYFAILIPILFALAAVSGTLQVMAQSAEAAYGPAPAEARPAESTAATAVTPSWDTIFGAPPSGLGVNGEVVAIAEDGDGNLYVGGAFNQVGGVTAYNIALWDGSAWHPLIDRDEGYNGVSGDVWAIAVDPATGDVYVGGIFARIDGNNAGPLACRLARWSPATQTWSLMADSSGRVGVDGNVNALAVMGGEVYVGGLFDGAATTGSCGTLNVAAPGLARWNTATGAWSDVGGSLGGFLPETEALVSDGSNLYVGGYFSAAGGVSTSNIALWDGSTWSALGAGISGTVSALAVDSGILLAGGSFTQTADGVSANNIAQWDGAAWSALGEGIGGVCMPGLMTVNAIALDSNELYTRIYVGGLFQTAGGNAANNVALWDGSTWSGLDSGLGISPVYPCEANDSVNDLGMIGSTLYAGGTFLTASGVDSYHYARWVTSVPTYAVNLSPPMDAAADSPGSVVTYALTVFNTGQISDSYALTLGNHAFPAQLSANSVGPLAANGQASLVLSVTIPANADNGLNDTLVITATSQTDGAVWDTAQFNTEAAVPPACQTLLDESFSSGATPTSWTVVDNSGAGPWRFDDPGGRGNLTGGSGGFAIADSDFYAGILDTELRTPSLDLSASAAATLTFKTDFYWYNAGGDETADVDYSTDGGSTWSNIWRKTGADYRGPITETLDLSAAAGSNQVLVRFHYYNSNYDWWWQVDDVNLTACQSSGAADYTLLKDDGGITVTPGTALTYTLRYTNTGSVAGGNVTLSETVPANTVFNAAASTSGWTCADGAPGGTACAFSVGDLSPSSGGAAVFGVTVTHFLPPDVTSITNTATLTDGQGMRISASDTTPLHRTSSLTITKTDGVTQTHLGAILVYTITVTNNGTQDALNVSLGDELPLELGFLSATGGGVYSPTQHSIIWPPLSLAGYGGSSQVTVQAVVNGPFTDTTGVITNGAAISESVGGLQVAYDVDTVQSLHLGNLVWFDTNGNGIFDPGSGEQGAPEVVLNLYLDEDQNDQLNLLTDTLVISASTDANGHYTFTNLVAGDYLVQVAPSNFASGGTLFSYISTSGNGVPAPDPDNDLNNDDNGDDVSGQGTLAKAVTLNYGSEPVNDGDTDPNTNLTVDFGFVNGGSISGVKFDDWNGNGVHDTIPGFTVRGDPVDIVTADFNQDGFLDIATLGKQSSAVAIRFGNGRGVFNNGADYQVGQNPNSMAVGDLNGDSAPDLVVANEDDGNISVLLNDGQGNFAPRVDYPVGPHPAFVQVGDINEDGKLDIVATGSANTLFILPGKGDGTFEDVVSKIYAYVFGEGMALGDINNDGHLDVVSVRTGDIAMQFGNGTFSFGSGKSFGSATLTPKSLNLADVDGNNILDAVVALGSNEMVRIFLNIATEPYLKYSQVSLDGFATDAIPDDLDNDSDIDIVIVYGAYSVTTAINDGSGSLSLGQSYKFSYFTTKAAVGDLNQDSLPDWAVIHKNDSKVSVRLADGLGKYQEPMEPGLSGWTIFVDSNQNNSLDTGEISDTTKTDGQYVLTSIGSGQVSVREVPQSGWEQSSTPPAPITFTSGTVITGVNFGNFHTIAITGFVFVDSNANGFKESGEPGHVGWHVYLDANDNGKLDSGEISTTTDLNGAYALTGLKWGVHRVRSAIRPGWHATTPTSTVITARSGVNVSDVNFGSRLMHVRGTKYDDLDGDGQRGSFRDYSLDMFSQGEENLLVDLNNDGVLDLVHTATYSSAVLSTRLGYSDGDAWGFGNRIDHTAGGNPIALEAADLNGDGNWDIVTSNDAMDVAVYLGKGDGTFSSPSAYLIPSGFKIEDLTLGDINGDAKTDIAVLSGYKILWWLEGQGNGSFSTPAHTVTLSIDARSLTLADVDHDNDLDFVGATHSPDNLVSVMLQSGGSFASVYTATVGVGPSDIAVGDLNGDTHPDIVTVNRFGATVTILQGDGNGNFGSRKDLSVGGFPNNVMLLDVDLDGDIDIVVSNDKDSSVSVLLNDANSGNFSRQDIKVDFSPSDIASGLLNKDSYPDLVTINRQSASILYGYGNGDFHPKQEPGIPGWTIFLDANDNDVLDSGELSTTTDYAGAFTFTVPITSYRVREVQRAGWVQTTPNPAVITTTGKDVLNVDFGNFKLITVTGGIYEDMLANGKLDGSDQLLSGRYAFLDANSNGLRDSGEVSTTTNALGLFSFPNLGPGAYTVTQELPAGWAAVTATYTFQARSGQDEYLNFGSYRPVTLGDRAWRDLDADGVQDIGESGLPGVTVTLSTLSGRPLLTATTSITGSYAFTGVRPGVYYLTFTLPAPYLFSPRDMVTDTQDSDANMSTGATAAFTLTSGMNAPDWDVGGYRLAILGNRVWSDANYDGVQDPGENGLPGVTVTLYLAASSTPLRTTVTNNNGEYSFAITPGDYKLKFTRLPGYIFTVPDNIGDDALDSDADAGGNTMPFFLEEGSTNNEWDAGLVELATVGNRVWYDADHDGIQDAEEPGQPGITVTLYNSSGAVDYLITNGDGFYTFTNVTPGSYYIKVEKPAKWEFSPQHNPAAPSPDHDSDVDPANGETDYFTLNPGQRDSTQDAGIFPLPSTIISRMWHDLDGDGIQDSGEPGLSGAGIHLYYVGNNLPYKSGTTGADGIYTFTQVLPGDYFLSFTPPGGFYLTAHDQGADDSLDSDADSNFTSLHYAETVSFTISAGTVITTWDAGAYQVGAIGGRVWFDQDFDGLQDVTETLGITGISVQLIRGDFILTTTLTDAQGNYTFTQLSPGDYTLRFPTRPTLVLSPQDQGSDDALDSDADPQTGKTVTITLSSGEQSLHWDAGGYQPASIRGLAWLDNDNGIREDPIIESSIPNLTVTLITRGAVLSTTLTGPDGHYTFTNLQPGAYIVKFPLRLRAESKLAPADQGSDDTLDSDADPDTGQTSVITLTTGQDAAHWDAGYVVFDEIILIMWVDKNLNSQQDSGETDLPTSFTVNLWDLTNNRIEDTLVVSGSNAGFFHGLWNGTYQLEFLRPNGYLYLPVPPNPSNFHPALGRTDSFTATYSPIGLTVWTFSVGFYQPTAFGSITPDAGGTVRFTDGQGNNTQTLLPPGAVTDDVTLYLTNLSGGAVTNQVLRQTEVVTPTYDPPTGYVSTNHEFYLTAEQNGQQLDVLTFTVPVSLTIQYSQDDVAETSAETLTLFFWNPETYAWVPAADLCPLASPQVDPTTNTFASEICQTGRYALFGQATYRTYLPLISRP